MGKTGTLRRVLRPLAGWLLLLLVLFGIRIFQKVLHATRLNFTLNLNGQNEDVSTTLDGKPFFSGQNISPGRHTFSAASPKYFSAPVKFFAWFGKNDLGEIKLSRLVAIVGISSVPPVPEITITGPGFSTNFYDCASTNLYLPTDDDYTVTAAYPPYWSETRTVTVANGLNFCNFTPQLGGLHLTANKDVTTYRLQFPNGEAAGNGNLPASLAGLPAGEYRLTATYHDRPIAQTVTVKTGVTNEVPIKFVLGMAHIETIPSGAEVRTANGNYLGQTPLDIWDQPESVQLNLSMNGYDSMDISVTFIADQTNECQTNLINTNYRGAMSNARKNLANGDYHGAVLATSLALSSMPNDSDALALQAEANTQLMAQQKVIAEKQRLQSEQTAKDKDRLAQLDRPREVFDALCQQYPEARLFTEQSLNMNQSAKTVSDAIVKGLPSGFTAFEILRDDSPKPDVYEITAKYTLPLGIMGGMQRIALIVVGQTEADKTQVYFKVLEYQIKPGLGSNKQLIPVSAETMPMDGIKQNQIKTGIKIVNERIQLALGNG
jgi:hypothetical protein